MGPPELPGGNSAAAGISVNRLPSLQWGRRNYPAETPAPPGAEQSPAKGFNGAAGITRRKLVDLAVAGVHDALASMGPPELPGGNPIA